jgi:hypothetical protein
MISIPNLQFPSMSYVSSYNQDETAPKYEFAMAIPNGEKKIVWLTTRDKKKQCIISDIDDASKNEFIDIQFHSDLFMGKGTIFSGTLFFVEKVRFFSIEDIFYHKGINISNQSFRQKLDIISTVLSNRIENYIKSIFFGIPIISRTISELRTQLQNHESHPIEFLHLRSANHIDSMKYIKHEEIVFIVKSEKITDLYSLFCMDDDEEVLFHGYAHIPSYSTSLKLNQYFKKEKADLDTLEESDDEEGKEQEQATQLKMICNYNLKYNKWEPTLLADDEVSVVKKSLLDTIV